jgi:imidazolonepropionase-like amidohydrolase
MRTTLLFLPLALSLVADAAGAQRPTLSPAVRQYVTVDTPVVVIRNVRVIDGTGAAARENQTVVIRDDKIAALGSAASTQAPAGALIIDGTGKTLTPGFVLVHEHLFYPSAGTILHEQTSFPRLYLGGGITTARTAGSMSPYADLNIGAAIREGRMAGPKLDVTGPFLNGVSPFLQMYGLRDAADARRHVNAWADLGATSFKAYMQITRDQLRAAVDEAHKRGIKVTGHLCSVTFREAAEIGIDNLEHGIAVATDFVPGKRPDVCPTGLDGVLAQVHPATDTIVKSIIASLVRRGVAVTSTLAVFEIFAGGRPPTPRRILDAMTPDARLRYLEGRAESAMISGNTWTPILENEMAFEKMFVDAGGLLLVGTDPTGFGGVIPGLSSQRAIELLVEAGFTPIEAIKIATLNGATYLGRADRVGTIAVGKDADLLLIAGDPGARIADIEKLDIVFKDGVGYDSAKLIASGRGTVGQ